MSELNIKELIEINDKYLMNTYGRFPIAMDRAYDCTIVDTDGKEYLDFLSGIAVINLGYSNDKFKNALKEQVDKILHTSNFFHIAPQAKLAKLLCENSFADRAFFSNSGAESNEGAIKIARKRAYLDHGEYKNHVVAMSSAFHGRTLATLSVTDSPDYKVGFGPEPEGFSFSPYNDIEALEEAVTENTCAIIMEPLQGEGGVHTLDKDFVKKARELADKYDAALIFDEIQTGMGRTGKLFCYEHFGVEPDIMTLAKGLGNGAPVGAILAKGDYATTFQPGDHGTTFGGNFLATAAGVAVVEEMLDKQIPELAAETGAYFKDKLKEFKDKYDFITEVRGQGLLLGMELDFLGGPVVAEMLDRGFILNCTQGNILRFLPPLVIKKEEIDKMLKELEEVLVEKSKE